MWITKRGSRAWLRAGEWGDHVTFQAAADAYGTRICLVSPTRTGHFARGAGGTGGGGAADGAARLLGEHPLPSIVPMGEAGAEAPA